jgi:hypothetical protein
VTPWSARLALAAAAELRGLLAVALIAGTMAACDGTVASGSPGPGSTVPPDWVTVRSSTRDVQLTLPPWLVPFDTVNAIFANEPPAPGAPIAVQLIGSAGAVEEPRPGEDVAAWMDRLLADPGSGVPVVTRVSLPAGPAVRYERVDRAATPDAWHLLVFAIRTPSGHAWLQIDASPDGWQRRASDFDRIAQLLRVR